MRYNVTCYSGCIPRGPLALLALNIGLFVSDKNPASENFSLEQCNAI